MTPIGESLEGRQLLAVFTGFAHVRHIATASGIYSLQLSDQSILKVSPAGNGQIDVKVLGTTSHRRLSITQIRPRYHTAGWSLFDQQPRPSSQGKSAASWQHRWNWTER